jgi:eukaryotic-like serine/threonine-protein kinase
MYTGKRLNNRYEVLSKISIKGYRQKWLALNLENNNKVLIETLHDDLINNVDAINSIRYELEVSTKLSFPLFPVCIDTFNEESRMYLVWEYFDNETLNQAYANNVFHRKLDVEIIKFLIKIGKGIRYAFDKGILHGHINGHNVTLDEFLTPKLTNFSLNQSLEETDPGGYTLFSTSNLARDETRQDLAPTLNSEFYALGMIGKILLTKEKDSTKLKTKTTHTLNRQIDSGFSQVIDGLLTRNPTVQANAISLLLDESFLDTYSTPVNGIPVVDFTKKKNRLFERLKPKNKK